MQATLEELGALRAKMTALDDELCEQVALLQEQLLTEKSRSGKAEAGLRAELEQAQRHIGECPSTGWSLCSACVQCEVV